VSVIFEWKLDGVVGNLGDSLTFFIAPQEYVDDPDKMYFVIGSVIDNVVIRETLDLGYKPVFMNCGWRGEKLDPDLVAHCEFVGARGPLTQYELLKHGVVVEVTGDPGYKIPNLVPKAKSHGLSVVVPHIQDPKRHEYAPEELGVDLVVQPDVTSNKELVEKLNLISGSSFVFAGAMHAGILAHAYNVPFGLMDRGYVNVPTKWEDWLMCVGVKCGDFYSNAKDGRRWWVNHVAN